MVGVSVMSLFSDDMQDLLDGYTLLLEDDI